MTESNLDPGQMTLPPRTSMTMYAVNVFWYIQNLCYVTRHFVLIVLIFSIYLLFLVADLD